MSSLIIGLGNPLAGDDGIGQYVVELLATDPRTPHDTEVLSGSTDLLRFADRLAGRTSVYIIDAVLNNSEPGTISIVNPSLSQSMPIRQQAHCLSPLQAVVLLQNMVPELRRARFTFIGISVDSARMSSNLSNRLGAMLPGIVEQILQIVST